MKCEKCNNILSDDSNFCQFCGEDLNNTLLIEKNNRKMSSNKTKFRKNKNIKISIIDSSIKSDSLSNVKNRYCKLCGGIIDIETKKCESCGKQYFKLKKLSFRTLTITTIIMFVFLLILTISNIYLYCTNNKKNSEIITLKATISTLKENDSSQKLKINSLQKEINNLNKKNRLKTSELNFYEKYAVIVCDDGTKKYHTYECEDCDISNFWIYNIDYAEEQGYYACQKCH